MMQTITIRGQRYDVQTLTGEVANATKHLETVVRGGGGVVIDGRGGSAPVTSRTVVHDHVFVVDRRGREHALKFTGWDLQCRAGHSVAFTMLTRAGASTGAWVAMRNDTLGQEQVDQQALRELCTPAIWPYVTAAFGTAFLSGAAGLPQAFVPVIGAMFWGAIGVGVYQRFAVRRRELAKLTGELALAAA